MHFMTIILRLFMFVSCSVKLYLNEQKMCSIFVDFSYSVMNDISNTSYRIAYLLVILVLLAPWWWRDFACDLIMFEQLFKGFIIIENIWNFFTQSVSKSTLQISFYEIFSQKSSIVVIYKKTPKWLVMPLSLIYNIFYSI